MDDNPKSAGQPGVIQYLKTGKDTDDIDISTLIEEARLKINELIYQNENLRMRLDRSEKVSLKLIGQLAAHQHLSNGKPAIAIELLNLQ